VQAQRLVSSPGGDVDGWNWVEEWVEASDYSVLFVDGLGEGDSTV